MRDLMRQKAKIATWVTSRRAPVLALFGGLFVTSVAFTFFQWDADREVRENFEQRSERFALKVQMRLQEAMVVSRDIRAMVESGVNGDARGLQAFARLGGGVTAVMPDIRWIAFLAPAESGRSAGPSLASLKVLTAGPGAPSFNGGPIESMPEFAKAAGRAWQTGKPALYAPEDEQGVGVPVYLSVINRKSLPGRSPMLLAVALNADALVGEGLAEFLSRENRKPIEAYEVRISVAPAEDAGAQGRLLFATPAARQGQKSGPLAFGSNSRSWLEHERVVDLDGTRFKYTTSVARPEIDAIEDQIIWWALAIGLSSTLLLVLFTMRTVRARELAEDASRRLDSQVRSGEARFRNLVDSTRDWMWETDASGAISFTSGRVHALLGYTPREIHGKRGVEFGFDLNLERASASAGRLDLAAKHRNGQEVWLQCACSRFIDENGRLAGYRGVCSDITEARKNANRQRGLELELNRMDKVGTLEHVMSMLAHELNQPLAAISSYCGASVRMLRENSAPVDDVISTLKEAGTQAQAAAAVVRGIRQLIVQKEPDLASIGLENLIGNARTLAGFRLNQGRIQVESRLAPNLPAVRADEILIVQVLLNLLHNAIDALAEAADPRIRISATQEDPDWVRISIEDNGAGMSDEQLAHCFEPYVTSKDAGLGLGLSISQAIVESHGGTLKLVRKKTGGCIAEFFLPPDRRHDDPRGAGAQTIRRGP